MKILKCCFKHSSGTSWVAHQSGALDASLVNFSLLLDYLTSQVADPDNATMKKKFLAFKVFYPLFTV